MQRISILKRSDKLLRISRGDARARLKELRETCEYPLEIAWEYNADVDDAVALEAIAHLKLGPCRMEGLWFATTVPKATQAIANAENQIQNYEAMKARAADFKDLADAEIDVMRPAEPHELALRELLLELEDEAKLIAMRCNFVRDQIKAAIGSDLGITGVAQWPARYNGQGRYFQLERDR